MEVQSGVQQVEPRPLGSPRSGANQQNDFDDRQTDDSGRPSADNHSKDVQPASQTDDKKVSRSLPLLHRVCLNVCDDWWDPASLLSYSGWYGLYFYIEGRPYPRKLYLADQQSCNAFCLLYVVKHATWCGGHDNCRVGYPVLEEPVCSPVLQEKIKLYVLLVCGFSGFKGSR